MLHLYALTEHPAQLAAARGIEGSLLLTVEVDGIDAVFSEPAVEVREATDDAILAHAGVVEKVAELNDAVLPARLGRPYASEEALAEAVRARAPELRKALERVRGCAELGVRVVSNAQGAGAPARTGAEYMRSRLDAIRGAERVAEELHEAVRTIARDTASQILASPQFVLSAAFLVPRTEVDSFHTAVRAVERERPEFTFVCTGPWPPYSFALVDGRENEQR